MSKRNSSQLNETPDTVNVANSINKRVGTELELQNTTNAMLHRYSGFIQLCWSYMFGPFYVYVSMVAAFKAKFTKVSKAAEDEKVAILADTLCKMVKSMIQNIQNLQKSINRLEKGFEEDLRVNIREEIADLVKNDIKKEVENLKIIYQEN